MVKNKEDRCLLCRREIPVESNYEINKELSDDSLKKLGDICDNCGEDFEQRSKLLNGDCDE